MSVEIRSEHVEKAAKLIISGMKGAEFGHSAGYAVVVDGERLPPKAVVCVAIECATEEYWGPNDLFGGWGGNGANTILQDMGYQILAEAVENPARNKVEPAKRRPTGSRPRRQR